MDPETDIETKTRTDRPRRASRAPWDPPPRPESPRTLRHYGAGGGLEGSGPLGESDDDMGRGAD